MKKVTDKEFAVYGRVLDVDVNEFVDVMKDVPVVSEGTMYEPSVGAFEALPLARPWNRNPSVSFPLNSVIAAAIIINSMP